MKSIIKYIPATIVCIGLLASNKTCAQNSEPGPKRETVINLATAHKLALAHYPKVKNIDESLNQAQIQIHRAYAMILPTLSATANLVRHSDKVAFSMPNFNAFDPGNPSAPLPATEMVIQEKWDRSAGFRANLPLFNPGAISQIRMAREAVRATRWNALSQKENILFSVTAAYYQVNAIAQMIAVAEENLRRANEFVTHSRALQNAGQTTEIDVLRADITLSDAQGVLDDAKDEFEMAKLSLGTLIGQKGKFELAPPAKVSVDTAPSKELKKVAFQNRAEIKAAESAVKISALNKKATSAKWLPRLDMTFKWDWTGAEGFSGKHDAWMLIFGASWNVFDGGATLAEQFQRQSESAVAANNMRQATLDIALEIDKGIINIEKNQRNVAKAARQVELATRQYALVQKQYTVGMGTSLELMDATTSLARNKANLVAQQLQLDLSVLELRKAAGSYNKLAKMN